MAQYGYMAKIGADTSGLQSALKDVNSQLSAIDREINATNKALRNAGTAGTDSFEMLNQKSTELCNAVAAAETKLNDLRSVEEQMKTAVASGSVSAEEYRAYQREISNTEAQLRTYQNQLEEVNSALYGLDTQTDNSTRSQEVFANSMLDVRAAAQKVTDDLAFFVDGIKNVGSATFKSVKEVAEYSVKVGSAFDSAMSQTAAYSMASSEELVKLRNAAKEAGATTSKSATESAQALGYMSLAGWDVDEMLTGLMPMIRAAEAGNSDLARTSDLVTDSMSAMGVSTEELTHYLDICTTAQSNSNTTMNGLLEAYINCGGTLKNLNVPLEESATYLGTLANRGKKAAEAGTAFNSILVNLIGANKSSKTALDELGVSAWDAEGNFIGLTNTLYLLDDALKNCTQQQRNFFEAKIGGKTQMDTLQALLAGINDEYDSLYAKISDCDGALETTAVTMQSNLTGAITKMKSALEGVGNEIYEYLDEPLRDAVQSVTENLGTINESIKNGALGEALRNMSQSLSELIIKLADFAASRGIEMVIEGVTNLIDLLSWLADNADKVTIAIGAMSAGFAAFKVGTLVADIAVLVTTVTNFAAAAQAGSVAATALNTAIRAFQFAGVIAIITALTAAVIGLECAYYEAKIAADEAYISTDNTILKLNESRRAYEEQRAEIEKSCEKIDDNTEAAKKNWQTLKDLCDEQGNIVGSSTEVQKAIDGLNEYLGTNIQVIDGQIQGYKELNAEMENLIETMRLESKMRTMQPLYDEAI
ncbi:MAG: phage tail tape measure protein, partial [Oscillospiraceae bacterium]